MPFSAENWPTITPFKDGETRVASDSEFGDFTTLLVICPDDSTRIELNPQPTAPLPQEGFGMKLYDFLLLLPPPPTVGHTQRKRLCTLKHCEGCAGLLCSSALQALPRVAGSATAMNKLWLSCVLRDLSALKYECAGPASTVRLTRPICLTLLTCSVCPRRAAWDDDLPRHSGGLERSGLYVLPCLLRSSGQINPFLLHSSDAILNCVCFCHE